MKVDLNHAAPAQLPVEQSVKPAVKANTETAHAVSGDRTTFKADQTVQALANRALQSPEVRQSTVDAVRQAVNQGTYQSDASKTADAIVSHES